MFYHNIKIYQHDTNVTPRLGFREWVKGNGSHQIYLSKNWLVQFSPLVLKYKGQDYTFNIHLALGWIGQDAHWRLTLTLLDVKHVLQTFVIE